MSTSITPADNDKVVTGSQMYVWWLTNVRGYRVSLVKKEPTHYRLGAMQYKTLWTLRPPK